MLLMIFYHLDPFGAKLKAWNTHEKKYFINLLAWLELDAMQKGALRSHHT